MDLIKIKREYGDLPLILNALLLLISGLSGILCLSHWEGDNEQEGRTYAAISFGSAVVIDLVNRISKNEMALQQMKIDAEVRLIANFIQTQERTQAADLSTSSNQRIAELNLQNAITDAEAAVKLEEIKAKHANTVAQIQEYYLDYEAQD